MKKVALSSSRGLENSIKHKVFTEENLLKHATSKQKMVSETEKSSSLEEGQAASRSGFNSSGSSKRYDLDKVGSEKIGTRHRGTTLEWSGIHYSVEQVDKATKSVSQKTILENMSGIARPGELLAVMGTSGAGKSTLLDVLAGRLEANTLKGTLTSNGKLVDKKAFRKESGYVMQSDALFPMLTVRETIRYAAYLRIQNKTRKEKDDIVEILISLLR